MTSRVIASRATATVVAVTMCAASTGCASLLGIGASSAASAVAGGDGARGAKRVPAVAEPPGAVRARYRHTPERDGSERVQPAAYSMIAGAYDRPGLDADCQPVPIGLQELMHVPRGEPAHALFHPGPFELGVGGPLAHLLEPAYPDGVADGLLWRTAPALAHRGPACDFSSHLYVRAGPGGTDPLPLHR